MRTEKSRVRRSLMSLQDLMRYWRKMLCTRSRAGHITWVVFHQIKQRTPLLRPKLYLPYRELQALVVL
jgi:RNA-directed DNA polymerase